MSDPQRPPHIQRCTYQEIRGDCAWQCKLGDPHEGVQHDLPIDAEFGRDLDRAPATWLAATLRDRVARGRHQQRRIDELQAIAVQLAGALAGKPVGETTRQWVKANAPTTAGEIGWDR